MNKANKNVTLIFRDLDGCPPIVMPVTAYNRLTDELLKDNTKRSIDFDEVVMFIRRLSTDIGFNCFNFSAWWLNSSTSEYYWPKDHMWVLFKDGSNSHQVRISGLKDKYDTEACGVYCSYNRDFDMTLTNRHLMYNSIYGIPNQHFREAAVHIKDVIFNDPATIVFWSDGTKTVCTCSEQDIYDPEKGLALCVMKKMLYNNKGHIFNNAREKWLKKGAKKV